MNADRMVQIAMRMLMRMFMRKGMREVAKRTGSSNETTKRARQVMLAGRKINRF